MTCDYGMLNIAEGMNLLCSLPGCRKTILPADFESCYEDWDWKVKTALDAFLVVQQPLFSLIPNQKVGEVLSFLNDHSAYKSVGHLRFKGNRAAGNLS